MQGKLVLTIGENGPAFSTGIRYGEGLEVESVVGYAHNYSWEEARAVLRRMRP